MSTLILVVVEACVNRAVLQHISPHAVTANGTLGGVFTGASCLVRATRASAVFLRTNHTRA
eukprot:6463458-Amphidinium_carterae.1